MWTIIKDESILNSALSHCRGCYQEDIILGRHNLSGSTLRGKAKSYAGRYAKSRDSLLLRLKNAGISVSETIGDHNRRILILG
jgi:hypothetical protein